MLHVLVDRPGRLFILCRSTDCALKINAIEPMSPLICYDFRHMGCNVKTSLDFADRDTQKLLQLRLVSWQTCAQFNKTFAFLKSPVKLLCTFSIDSPRKFLRDIVMISYCVAAMYNWVLKLSFLVLRLVGIWLSKLLITGPKLPMYNGGVWALTS